MKAICFCNNSMTWGGGERWTYEIALALSARGWRVFALCNPAGALYAKLKACAQITTIGVSLCGFLPRPFLSLKLKSLFKKQEIHAVVLHTHEDLKRIGPAARKAGVEHIIYRRSSPMPLRRDRANRKLFRKVITRLVVNSETTGKLMLLENLNLVHKEKMSLIPNGIDAAAFDAELAETLPLDVPDDGSSFCPDIVLGALSHASGKATQNCLIYLVKELVDEGLSPRLVVGGEANELQALAAHLEVGKYVYFAGPMPERASFWKSIDCFVLTALWEGVDFVLGEAMLAQKPILAFAVSNSPDMVHDQVSGRLYAMPCLDDSGKRDLSSMVEGIKELAANPEMREKMGLAGRSFGLSKFSLEASAQALEALIWEEPEEDSEENENEDETY